MKDETIALMEKAERAIRSAERTMKDGDLDFAASRAYYAMFYIAEALLGEKGFHYSKHGGVHGAFAQHFVKTGEFHQKYQAWLVTTFSQRMIGDYGIEPEFLLADIEEILTQSREFLQAAQTYLNPK